MTSQPNLFFRHDTLFGACQGFADDLGGDRRTLELVTESGLAPGMVVVDHLNEVTVPLEEFLLPGRWEVVAAPSQVIGELEDGARGVEIILRHVAPHSTTPPDTSGPRSP